MLNEDLTIHEVACLAVLSPAESRQAQFGRGWVFPDSAAVLASNDCRCRLKPAGPRAPATFSRLSNRA
jgi:hypothetical protein